MKRQGGFTLIEVLVVVAIIGLLVTVASAGLALIKQRTRDSQRAAHVSDLRKALDLYINQVATYPVSVSPVCITGLDAVSTALISQKTMSKGVADPVWPTDSTFCYQYTTNASGSNYTLRYYLETSAVEAQGYHTVTN